MSQISDDVYKIRCKLKELVALQVGYKAVMHQPHTEATSKIQALASDNAINISALHNLSLLIRGKVPAHFQKWSSAYFQSGGSAGSYWEQYRIDRWRKELLTPQEIRTPEVA